MNEECLVGTTIREIFFLSRVLGTYPFFPKYEFNPWGLLFFTVNLLLFFYVNISEILSGESLLFVFLISSRFLTLTILPVVHLIWLFIQIPRMKELFDGLCSFERDLSKMNDVWDCRYKPTNKYLTFFLLVYGIVTAVITWHHWYTLSLLIITLWLFINVYTVLDQCLGIMSVIDTLLSQLKYVRENIQLLRQKEKLTSFCKIVEECYGPQLLLITTYIYVATITLLIIFMIIQSFNNLLILSNVLLTVYPLLRIILSSNSIIVQGKNLDKLLYRRLIAYPCDEMIQFHLIAKRDINFTACGFFSFRNALISSVIKTCTTYLVITMQYTFRK